MIVTEQVHIPLVKRKFAALLRYSATNMLVGSWFISRFWGSHSLFAMLISALGIVMILILAPLTYFVLKKWRDKSAGLTIDHAGITDNTYLFSAVHIPWGDIQAVKKTQRTLLIIFIDEPITFIQSQSGFVKRKVLGMAFKHYGSPIIINSSELKGDFNWLQDILKDALESKKCTAY